MDQEVYDKIVELLAEHHDQPGAAEFATLAAFHYPESGRALLVAVGALPESEEPGELTPA